MCKKSLLAGGFLSALLFFSPVAAQPVSKFTALNHYVAFANECIHMLSVMHPAIESCNRSAVTWQPGQTEGWPEYRVHRQLHSFSYYGWRQGVCTRIPAVKDPVENIRRLYEVTRTESRQIPETYIARLNEQRDELMYIMIAAWSLSDSLEEMIGNSSLITGGDHWPAKAQRMFRRFEILFHDFQAMRDKLAFTLQEVAGPAPPELSELRRLLFLSQQLIQAVRHDAAQGIEQQTTALQQAIESAEKTQETKIAELKKMDLYHSRDLTGYRYLISHARDILHIGEQYAVQKPEDPVIDRYGRNYFYYNRRLLPRYNHDENGMAAYYNSFVRFANTHLMQQVEEVPWFRASEIPLPVAQMADSVTVADTASEPIVNHLIFLLDISASMNKPEKLPLLKDALTALMSLMGEGDRISIVSYSGNAKRVLQPTSASKSDEIVKVIEGLRSGGMTHFRQGINIAYQVAEDHFIEGGNNRIILATDGAFKMTESTLRKVERKSGRDIPLTVFFMGKKVAAQTLRRLEILADAGGGNFAHITPATIRQALRKEARSLRE